MHKCRYLTKLVFFLKFNQISGRTSVENRLTDYQCFVVSKTAKRIGFSFVKKNKRNDKLCPYCAFIKLEKTKQNKIGPCGRTKIQINTSLSYFLRKKMMKIKT